MTYGLGFNPYSPQNQSYAQSNVPQQYSQEQQSIYGGGQQMAQNIPARAYAPTYDTQLEKDMENVYKYGENQTLVEQKEGMFDGLGLMAGISLGMQYVPKAWNYGHRKVLSHQINSGKLDAKTLSEKQAKLSKFEKAVADRKKAELESFDRFKNTKGFSNKMKLVHSETNANRIISGIPNETKLAQLAKENPKAYQSFMRAKRLAERAKANPAKSQEILKSANRKFFTGKVLAHDTKPTGFFGKIGHFLGKVTGGTKLMTALERVAIKHPKVGNLLKCGKGTGVFAMIAGGVELVTQVIPTFAQLGVGKGLKQLGKSAIKTVASVGGWAVGEAAGAEGGAAIGAAIGSVVPGVGTAIGAGVGTVCGLIGGFVGSYFASKAADKICGKNELDKANEEKAKQVAQQAVQTPEVMTESVGKSLQRLQAEGVDSPDGKVAAESLSRIAPIYQQQVEQAQAQAQQPQQQVQAEQQTAQYAQQPQEQAQYQQYPQAQQQYQQYPQYSQYPQMPFNYNMAQMGTMGGLTLPPTSTIGCSDITQNCFSGINPSMIDSYNISSPYQDISQVQGQMFGYPQMMGYNPYQSMYQSPFQMGGFPQMMGYQMQQNPRIV